MTAVPDDIEHEDGPLSRVSPLLLVLAAGPNRTVLGSGFDSEDVQLALAPTAEAPAMLVRLQQAVIENRNVFEVLMEAVRVCSLGQITTALFEVGGQYRRSM